MHVHACVHVCGRYLLAHVGDVQVCMQVPALVETGRELDPLELELQAGALGSDSDSVEEQYVFLIAKPFL